MNRYNDWKSLLEMANNELENLGSVIQVGEDSGFYAVYINGAEFASNCYEDELSDVISDAWANARLEKRQRNLQQELISFRIIHGWTHDQPALIWGLTNVDLFFRDERTGNIEKVEESIDFYEDRVGQFCVRLEDYDQAEQEIFEHDELGIEH